MAKRYDVAAKINAFYAQIAKDPHHRYRSWEHCYVYFRSTPPAVLAAEKNVAALQLAFYLASWGMYRGSAFLLQRAYTVHLGVIDALLSPQFSELWSTEVGANPKDIEMVDTIAALVDAVKTAYEPFGSASDILATKVILGTVASLPAVDRFFVSGFRESERQYSSPLNRAFIKRIIEFCIEFGPELRTQQSKIKAHGGMYYPLMKLADMYFWQIGYDSAPPRVQEAAKVGLVTT